MYYVDNRVPDVLPDRPPGSYDWELVKLPGYSNSVNWAEVDYLRSLKEQGVTELTPEMLQHLEDRFDHKSDRAGEYEDIHPQAGDLGRRSRSFMQFARSMAIPMAGLVVLAVLVLLVIALTQGDDPNSIEARLDAVTTSDDGAPTAVATEEAASSVETTPESAAATAEETVESVGADQADRAEEETGIEGTYTFGPLFDVEQYGYLGGGSVEITSNADSSFSFAGTVTYGDSLYHDGNRDVAADCVGVATVDFAGDIDPEAGFGTAMASAMNEVSYAGPDCVVPFADSTFDHGEGNIDIWQEQLLSGSYSFFYIRVEGEDVTADFPGGNSPLIRAGG